MSRPLPPHDLEAEKTVLGGVLMDSASFFEVSMLVEDDFYDPRHSAIWEAMKSIQRDAKPIDILTVTEELTKLDKLKLLHSLGGADYLVDLLSNVATIANLGYHAKRLRSKARRRAWLLYGRKVEKLALDAGVDDTEFIAEVTHGSHELQVTDAPLDTLVPMHAVMKDYKNGFDERWDARQRGQHILGMSSGIEDIDKFVGGFAPGDLIVVAGRPAMGKTTFTMNMIVNAAIAADPTAAAIFSFEMRQRKLAEKFIAQVSGIAAHKLKHATLSQDEWGRFERARTKLAGLPIWMCEKKGLDIYEIAAEVRRWAARNKIKPSNGTTPTGAVMIDYLQIVESADPKMHRERQVAEISRVAKMLALEIGMPVFLLSQVNRAVEDRDDKRPRMSDLRESGAIEQDADTILFVYREFVYTKQPEDANKSEIIIGKARDGETGIAHIEWDAARQRFKAAA